MDEATIQKQIAESRQRQGQRVADVSSTFEKYDPASDPTVNALRGQQSEKLKQLFAHDQQLADVRFNPQPTPAAPGEVVPASEPRLIDPTIGLRASSQQTMATVGEASDILKQIETRKDFLAGERDKALSMLQLLIQAGKDEQSALEKQMDWIFKKRDQDLEERRVAASEASSRRGTESEQLRSQIDSLTNDVRSGITIGQALRKYQKWMDPTQIYQIYQSSNSPHGLDKSTPEQLARFGIKTSSAANKLTAERERLKVNASSALKDLDKIEKSINSDPSVLWRSEIPGGLGVRDYLAARNNVMDVISRLRTGVAKRKEEDAFYESFVPKLGDSQQEIQDKIQRLKNYYSSFINGIDVFGLTPDMVESDKTNSNSSGGEWE